MLLTVERDPSPLPARDRLSTSPMALTPERENDGIHRVRGERERSSSLPRDQGFVGIITQ